MIKHRYKDGDGCGRAEDELVRCNQQSCPSKFYTILLVV